MATALHSPEASQPQSQHESQLQQKNHQAQQSPPTSTTSSPQIPTVSHRRSASPLNLDLSTLPPLTTPSPPSNTLLITQLNSPTIFHPASLATIRQHITSLAPLHSFSPLKSFRRIVCSFYTTEAAIAIRQHLDGASLLGNVRARVYFGEPTPIGEGMKYLERPDAGRLFFISPPPSPPVGWEAREEGCPNKDVHATDLADALGKLSGKMGRGETEAEGNGDQEHRVGGEEDEAAARAVEGVAVDTNANPLMRVMQPNNEGSVGTKSSAAGGANGAKNRSRSSTVIYDPETHGDSPALPAVMVEDMTMDTMDDEEEQVVTLDGGFPKEAKKIMAHTSRPPVELMGDA